MNVFVSALSRCFRISDVTGKPTAQRENLLPVSASALPANERLLPRHSRRHISAPQPTARLRSHQESRLGCLGSILECSVQCAENISVDCVPTFVQLIYHEWWPPLTMMLDDEVSNGSHPHYRGWYSLAPCAERARVAREPCHDPAQLVWPSNPAHRVQAGPLRQQMGLRVEVRCGHTVTRAGGSVISGPDSRIMEKNKNETHLV